MAVYGVDIGGTKIETAIFDDNLNLLKNWRVATPVDDYDTFLSVVNDLIQQADQFSGVKGIVGIGMPGLINGNGEVLSANIPCACGHKVKDDLANLLQRPIALANDTRCFALSEALSGAGQDYSRVFGAIIGTGAAGGFCVDGQLDSGSFGFAGEYGHIPLPADIQKKYQLPILTCGCGLTACVESYIAGPGIANLYQHFTGTKTSAIQWAQELKLQNVAAQKVLACYLDILGSTFATLCKFLEPDVIVLGGGVSLIDEIVDNLPKAIEKYLFNGFSAPVIKRATYGDASGVRGAALLGVKNDA